MTVTESMMALNMLPKIGPVRVRRLIEAFGSAQAVLGADMKRLLRVEGIGPELAGVIHDWQDRVDLVAELEEVARRGVRVIALEDEDYPGILKQSYDPPLVLYVWGELSETDRHAIGVVGSRRCTHYGMQASRQMAFQLASSGLTVVSGLARGIDTHAHEGAIAAKGRTIAVIGSGLGQIYPPENMGLAEKIADGYGAVVSEFPLQTPPSKKTFPMRNRIVACWSQGVLVVECPAWSGAMITAHLAGDLGRPIYAVPGPIDRPTSAGCHELIREGATLVTGGQDILDDLSLLPFQGGASGSGLGRCGESLTDSERLILSALDEGELLMDELLLVTALPMPELAALLLKLEIGAWVQRLAGGRFAKK